MVKITHHPQDPGQSPFSDPTGLFCDGCEYAGSGNNHGVGCSLGSDGGCDSAEDEQKQHERETETVQQRWRDEYSKALDDKGARAFLENPDTPEYATEGVLNKVDQRFCERLGEGADCASAVSYMATAGLLLTINFPVWDNSVAIARGASSTLVTDAVGRQLQTGWGNLLANHLSDTQRAAYANDLKNKQWGPARRWVGTALHNAVAADLERNHPGRFQYNASRAPDYLDRKTGVHVELTTRAAYRPHVARDGLYRMASYVLYRGPGRLPAPRVGGGGGE